MKIISKYKDYYDYLTGIYGIDEKLVLDRTKFATTETRPLGEDNKISFVICGYLIECLYKDGEYLYGKDIEKYNISETETRKWWYHRDKDLDTNYIVEMKSHIYGGSRNNHTKFLKEPKKLDIDINEILNCPVLIQTTFSEDVLTYKDLKFFPFPILKDYNFVKMYSPEKIWLELYNFLSRTKEVPDTQTDKQKIVSKGFDLKHSFRNTK